MFKRQTVFHATATATMFAQDLKFADREEMSSLSDDATPAESDSNLIRTSGGDLPETPPQLPVCLFPLLSAAHRDPVAARYRHRHRRPGLDLLQPVLHHQGPERRGRAHHGGTLPHILHLRRRRVQGEQIGSRLFQELVEIPKFS